MKVSVLAAQVPVLRFLRPCVSASGHPVSVPRYLTAGIFSASSEAEEGSSRDGRQQARAKDGSRHAWFAFRFPGSLRQGSLPRATNRVSRGTADCYLSVPVIRCLPLKKPGLFFVVVS